MKQSPEFLYIGVLLDKSKETVIIACVGEDEAKCHQETKERSSGLPTHVMKVLGSKTLEQQKLYDWLTLNGVPEKDHLDVLKTICEGICEGLKGKAN